jgi:hypothetical protein
VLTHWKKYNSRKTELWLHVIWEHFKWVHSPRPSSLDAIRPVVFVKCIMCLWYLVFLEFYNLISPSISNYEFSLFWTMQPAMPI